MEISYTHVGDYLLPNIRLSDPPDAPPLGRYGMMHKEYLTFVLWMRSLVSLLPPIQAITPISLSR